MNIFDLAKTPDAYLGAIEHQQKYLLTIWAGLAPCPWCGAPQRVFDVYGLNIYVATYDDVAAALKTIGHCIACKKAIQHDVPIFTFPYPYVWTRAEAA